MANAEISLGYFGFDKSDELVKSTRSFFLMFTIRRNKERHVIIESANIVLFPALFMRSWFTVCVGCINP